MLHSTSELLDAAKRGAGIPSNYRLARVLGTNDNTLSRWHSGRVIPDDAYAVRLAAMAGLDAGYVIASMRALREKDPELRAIWARMAERLLTAPDGPNGGPGGSGHGPDGEDGDFGPSSPSQGGSDVLMSGGGADFLPITHIMRSPISDSRERRRVRIALVGRHELGAYFELDRTRTRYNGRSQHCTSILSAGASDRQAAATEMSVTVAGQTRRQ